jgi:hypothetical protein
MTSQPIGRRCEHIYHIDKHNQHSCQEGATASLLPKAAEEIQHATPGPPNTMAAPSRALVASCPGMGIALSTTARPPAGGKNSPEHHWDRAPAHLGHLLENVPEEDPVTS